MDVLSEWLKTTILHELSDGLRWLDGSSGNSGANISHFEDDGNTLRAKVSKSGVVQITKLVTFEEPIQAWASDSMNRLLVTFDASAVRRYRYETRKRLTQDPLGGLIQIKDFEIVATHLGPRPYRLTILIKDFQSLGSVGSGGFGMPHQLEALPEVRKLLDRLKILRLEEPCKSHQEVSGAEGAGDQNLPSSTQSGITCSISSSSDGSRSASQENFATQVPRSRLAESSNLTALKSNDISRRGNSNGLPASPNRPLISRPIIEKPVNAPTKVLKTGSSALNASAVKSVAQLQPSDLSPKKPPARVKNQLKDSISATELLELLSRNQAPKLSRRSNLNATPAEPVVLRSEGNDLSSSSHDVRLEMDEQSEEATNLPVKLKILPEAQASTVTTGVTPCVKLNVETNRNIEILNLIEPVANGGPLSLSGSSRINHREVKISKDQQALLDCSDCWIPAEPGQRQPVGNIPIAILQRISDQVEGHLHHLPEPNRYPNKSMRDAETTTGTSFATSDSESYQDSEPEIPISSAQWPPSSPPRHIQEQLPPDSSMEASAQTIELEEEIGEVHSIRKRRKLSHSSTSSCSVISNEEHLTTSSRRLTKTIRSSPALPTTPSRQELVTSRPSETEIQEITMEQRGLVKDSDKPDTHSAASHARTPNSIASEKSIASENSIAAWQTCIRCHVQFHSPGILPQHEKLCSRETNRNGQDSDDFNFTQKVENPENLPVLFPETTDKTLSDESMSEDVRTQIRPSAIPDQTEFNDHGAQQMMNKAFKRVEASSIMISPKNTNLISHQPDFGRNSDSSELKNTPEISDQPSSNISNKHLASTILEQQIYPSTASGSEEAVLQVKATPYVNGHLYKSASADPSPLSSPSRKKNSLISDRAYIGKPKGTLPSPTIFEIGSAHIVSSKPMEDILSEFESSEAFKKDSTCTVLRPSDQNVRGVAEFPSSGSACHVPTRANDITHVEDTFISATAPPETSNGGCAAEDPPKKAGDDSQGTKRKFLGMQPYSHDVAKRQKHVKSSTSNCSQEFQTIVEPSTLGSKYRHEFHNSRESSTASLGQEAEKSSTMNSQASSPGSYIKCQSDGGLPGRKENSDAPFVFPPPKQTPVLKSDNGHVSEAKSLPEDKEQYVEGTLKGRDQATKTGWSSTVVTGRADVQVIDQMKVQNAVYDPPANRVGSLQSCNVFDQFKATYPHYIATLSQFVAICRKMERLVKDEHMEHQYLWDDFIIRHKTEYPNYLNSCAENAEDPLPYEQFYHNNIAKPLFTQGVVKPENLSKVFFPNQQVDASSQQGPEGESNLGVENVTRRTIVKNPIISPTISLSTPKPISPRVTVDLTSENEASPTQQRRKLMNLLGRKSPRSLPWATSHKSQVENTPTRRVISRTSSSSYMSNSFLFSAPPSSFRPPKASGWVSSSPKKVAFCNDTGPESPPRARTTHDGETGEAFPAVIQNQSSVPILNQSASVERLDLIYVAEGQNSGSVSYKATKPNQDTTPRPSDVPEQREHSRGTSTSQGDQASSKLFRPQGTSKAKTRRDEQQEGRVKDKNIQFGSFARAYVAIRNGNGNSYARDRESGNKDDETMPENITPKLKQIDVLSWRL